MTCIVGIQDEHGVTIGGDSAGVAGTEITMRGDEKVYYLNYDRNFLIGSCGSFRLGQLLRYSLTPPKYLDHIPPHRYLATDFIDAVRACLSQGGFSTTEHGKEYGGFFLLGFRGRLYTVDHDYQVGIPSLGYAATGDGRAYALGSLYTTRHWSNTESRVLTALKAAQEFGTHVRAPFVIKSL